MRRVLPESLSLYSSLSRVAAPALAQGAPPQGGADQPYTIEYYYKVQWGHQQEFHDLFLKNHYPLLKKIQIHRPYARRSRLRRLRITPLKTAAGIIASPLHSRTPTVATTRIPTKKRSSSSFGPIRKPTKRKSSAGSRFLPLTGICRHRHHAEVIEAGTRDWD